MERRHATIMATAAILGLAMASVPPKVGTLGINDGRNYKIRRRKFKGWQRGKKRK